MNAKFMLKISQMSPSQLYEAVYCDCLTGVLNRQAFDESLPEADVIAVVDLDSLKYLNDTSGHRAGDAFLVSLARTLSRCAGEDNVFRISGDEFAVLGKSVGELLDALEKARALFPGFSFGIGVNVESADARLRADKAARERRGLRAGRGECPPWMETTREKVAL